MRAATQTAVAVLMAAACSHPAAQHPATTTATTTAPTARAALSADVVVAKVQGGYANGVRRCYARYLKHASGHGRVLVSFTIDERGFAQDGAASGVPPKLGDCIVAEVARWRFPAPAEAQSFALPIDLSID